MAVLRLPRTAVAAVLALALAGCGSNSSTPATVKSAGTSASGFPVEIRSAGAVTLVPHDPRRIISLSPTATEDLFAIGAGPQVIAVDAQSDYPPTAPHTKLSGFQPNVEAIAAYHPDLVVISDGSPAFLAPALRKLNIPVLVDPAAHTLAQAYEQISALARASAHSAQARALVSAIRAQIADYLSKVAAAGRGLSVYDEIEQSLYAASSRTFVGQLLRLFGLRNVADEVPDKQGVGYPQLSAEYLLTANPDIVLLSDTVCCGQNAATVARRPGWSQMTAVRDHTIVPINDDIASRWGPRVVDLAADIAHAVEAAHAAGLRG
jgi:iron complex transport system substrate-binding protein